MTWDVFISHASEDQLEVACPLADMLLKKGVNVWYAPYSLNIGESLRASIDDGLAKSRYGVVILSPNFFGKRWPKNELDGLIALETSEKERILPVWHRVSATEVMNFSPILAGRVGIPTDIGLDNVASKIVSKVYVYRIKDHHNRTCEIDLSESEAHGVPIVPHWFQSDTKRINSLWLEERLRDGAELRLYLKRNWCDGTWFVVDVLREDGEVINLDQLRDLMPTTATTTTTTTTPLPDQR